MKEVKKKYLQPSSVSEAISMARQYSGTSRYLAGGTDVVVNKFMGNDPAECLIDISKIIELRSISENESHLRIGSMVRLSELEQNTVVKDNFPALCSAARAVASPVIRKTATIGGNVLCENRCNFYNQGEWWREAAGYCLKCDGDICIATGGKKNCFSKFVSDTAPVFISLNAMAETEGPGGKTIVPLEEIYTGNGLNPRNFPENSMLCAILLPLKENKINLFRKLRPRLAVDFTSLTVALSVNREGDIKIVLGGVDPGPVIIEGKFAGSKEEIIKNAVKKARIVNNDYYPREYRKEMIGVFLTEMFGEIENNYR